MTTTTYPRWSELCKVDVPEGTHGNVRIERFEVPEFSIENLRLAMRGRSCVPGTYTKLIEGNTFWMSDTSAEIYDHLDALRKMYYLGGRVLINGLGLGMVLKAALALPDIEHVDVVESNADIIALVGPHYVCDRLTIHHADAYAIQWPVGTRWSVAWHDIWPEISEENLPGYTKLKRKYGRRVDWQGCWAEDTVQRERRRTRNAWWR